MDQGGNFAVVDLRDAVSLKFMSWRIPGARIMSIDEIEARHEEVARDQDIVLYCT
ncbi:MAG TPA: rhodanese-like domain-containing protein [Myxococcales bacterium]|nr:rhodanese-like domain-containing protein [Myxococcales bacterium]HIM02047.1 rhodanese-like domain-containing protein [Myxococcales bacterium]